MGRAPCCDKMGVKKGQWTAEEDKVLVDFITENGHGNWRALPRQAGLLRCGKSCRLRWTNYLRPDIKRGNFSIEEEDTIIKLHHLLGNRWSAIASRLPGRTDNEIKNVWNTQLKKRLLRMGIDPVTHRPTMPSSSVANCKAFNFNSVENAAPSMPDNDASEHLSSTDTIDNDNISTVGSSSTSVSAMKKGELNACMDSVDMEGLAYNQINPAPDENEFNPEEEFFINESFIWGDQRPVLSHDSNEILRFQEKRDHVSSIQPTASGFQEDADLFSELQNYMDDVCKSTSPIHQLWSMQLQKDDDCIDFWLNMLGQVGPLPTVYQHLASHSQLNSLCYTQQSKQAITK